MVIQEYETPLPDGSGVFDFFAMTMQRWMQVLVAQFPVESIVRYLRRRWLSLWIDKLKQKVCDCVKQSERIQPGHAVVDHDAEATGKGCFCPLYRPGFKNIERTE